MHLVFEKGVRALFVIAISFFVASILFLFFKPLPIFYHPIKKIELYTSVDLSKVLFVKEVKKKKEIKLDFKLKGIYSDKNRGFVILEDKKNVIFLDLGSSYKGFKLIKIGKDYIKLKNENKTFTLTFDKKLEKLDNKKPKKITYPKERMDKVQRSLIKFYKRNLRFVWRWVSIRKTDKGYKVVRVDPNSIIAKLGLREGDIILKVNGKDLNNDNDAWRIYNNIQKYDEVRITILRNNKLKELRYEIY